MSEDYFECKLCGGTLAYDEKRNTIGHTEPVCEKFRIGPGRYPACKVQLGDGITRRDIDDDDRGGQGND